jgi:class 3 adenylate cyclase
MSDPAPTPEALALRAFLQALGLSQYAAAFEEQALEVELLTELTDSQFEQLGVKAMGHRVKLRRAAAEQAARQAAAALAGPGGAEERAAVVEAPKTVPNGGERRQLTVMFCDLVGSTAMSQRMDPEDLRALMQRYQRVAGEVIAHHGGTVAQFLGDGLMVYFGWPRAREDDAARAVTAALRIVEAVKGIDTAEPPSVRIGIATGPVVVGQHLPTATPGDASVPSIAVGETPNLAARVQGQAEPDQVLIAAGTRRLVGQAFVCEDLGERACKGIAAPVRLWRVMGENEAGDRFAAAHGSGLTPLVNRDLEISLLLDRWARAQEGEGQVVLLAGEPGIGKSRVLAELGRRVPAGQQLFRLQCSELHAHSAFYPLLAQLQRSAGVERDDAADIRLDKLEALLTRLGAPTAQRAPYFAALLGWPAPRYAALRASGAKLKQETIGAFVQTVLDAARAGPQLLLAEDLHWMDPSTLEAIDALVLALRRAPVLLVLTSRHTMGSRWATQPHATALTMTGLNRSHSLQLAGAVAAAHGLTQRMLDRIVARTDGVPLFVEELTRTLAEGASLRGGGVGAAESIEIPSTLKDSLTARLDQLGEAKRVAQLGSVLGRQFRHAVLLALHGSDEAALQAQLEPLLAAGLASRAGAGADTHYTFHHALVQDAAYESLLKSERRQLHARAGEILLQQQPELADTEPEVLARHFGAGERWDQAVPLWLKAGQRAWQRAAAQEAIAHLEAGLQAVGRVADPAVRDSLELRLQSALGVVYFAAVSYAAPQAQAAFQRAEALCERVHDVALKVPVLYGVGAFQTMKGDARSGHQAFERLQQEADAAGQARLQLYAQAVLAWSHYNVGEHERCIAAAERVASLYARGALAGGARLGAADPKVISECFRSAALWAQGHVDQARVAADELLAHARELGDPYSLAYALNFAALLVPDLCGERTRVVERADEGIRLAAELGYPFLEVYGILWRTWQQGQGSEADPAAALAEFDAAMARLDSMGVRFQHAQLLARRARLLLRCGQEGAAQLAVAQALAEVEASGFHSVAPDVYLAEGEVMLAHGGEQRQLAAAAFRMAADIARQQGARSWQLRATLALARLDPEGDPAVLRQLEALLATFNEGRDSADHREAAALLARSSAPSTA